MAQTTQGISKLMLAEKEANEIIDKARKERIRRSKEAESKAKVDIEKFKKELDDEFQKYSAQGQGDSEETFRKLRIQTEADIVQQKQSALKNKDQVVSTLLKYVGNVHTEVHPNIVVAQKLGYAK